MPMFGWKTILIFCLVGHVSAYLLDGRTPIECVDRVTNNGCSYINCTSDSDKARMFCPLTCGYCTTTPPQSVVTEITTPSTKAQKCVDNPDANCGDVTLGLCSLPHFLSIAVVQCPVRCGFCTPCIDTEAHCPAFRSLCGINELVTQNCSLTCKACSYDYDPQALLTNHGTTGKIVAPTSSTPIVSPVNTNAFITSSTLQPTSAVPLATKTTVATTPTTVATTTTTLPPLHSRTCDKFGIIFDVAKGNLVSSLGTRACADGIHQPPEAVVQQHCRAPTLDKWTRTENVLANCDRIQSYSAIAGRQSEFGGTTVSGVFITCDAESFQAAIQTCDSALSIIHVNLTSSGGIPAADRFYLINWN